MKITRLFSENVSFGRKYLRQSQKELTTLITEMSGRMTSVYLWDKTLHSKERGVSDERYCDEEVVVSLTTYGDRIHDVHLAIESIMQQTMLPNRIVLWLAEDEFKGKTLPVALRMQLERGLEIAYCEDLRSYKKLIPSLRRFPEACIVTVDDDIAYSPDFIEKMVRAHKEHPSDICASRIHRIVLDATGKPAPYLEWQLCVEKCPKENNLAFFTGCGGILYPPGSLPEEVFNQDVFMGICSSADDVWFSAMRLLNGIKVTKIFSSNPEGDIVFLPSSRVTPLCTANRRVGNDDAIDAVFGRYGLFEKLTGANKPGKA